MCHEAGSIYKKETNPNNIDSSFFILPLSSTPPHTRSSDVQDRAGWKKIKKSKSEILAWKQCALNQLYTLITGTSEGAFFRLKGKS